MSQKDMEVQQEEQKKKLDEFCRQYGVTKPQDPLRLAIDNIKVKIPLAYYDSFTCKLCKQEMAFLLPKNAEPCILHIESICCDCCMYQALSSYCAGRDTSYCLRL